MIDTDTRIYSISIPFPSKRWLFHSCLPACLIIAIIIGLLVLKYVYDSGWFYLLGMSFAIGYLFYYIYSNLFNAVSRIDICDDEVVLYSRALFFNTIFAKKIKRAKMITTTKKGWFRSTKLVFKEDLSTFLTYKISTNGGWQKNDISLVYDCLNSIGGNDESASEPQEMIKASGNKHGLTTDYWVTLVAILGCGLLCWFCGRVLWPVIALVLFLVIVRNELHVKVSRVIADETEIAFFEDEWGRNAGVSRGYFINPEKSIYIDTYDWDHTRVLKIKKEGMPSYIRLSKRNGWTDTDLDSVKELLSRRNNVNA